MLSLIVAILFGLSITYFAFQNAVGVPVTFIGYQLLDIPLYLVVVISVLSGIVMAWFISTIEGLSNHMTLRKKDHIINNDRKEMESLQKKVQDLEVENTKLRGEHKEVVMERRDEHAQEHDITHKPSFLNRLFPNSNRKYSKQI